MRLISNQYTIYWPPKQKGALFIHRLSFVFDVSGVGYVIDCGMGGSLAGNRVASTEEANGL